MLTAYHMAATTLPEFQCNEPIAILSSLVTLPEQEFQALGSECFDEVRELGGEPEKHFEFMHTLYILQV